MKQGKNYEASEGRNEPPFKRMVLPQGAEKNNDAPRIVLVLGDVGSVDYILPVLPRLNASVTILADAGGAAVHALVQHGATEASSSDDPFQDASLVLCGTAGKSFRAWRHATLEAKKRDIPCVWFGDFFGSGSEEGMRDLVPDWIALFDQSSKILFKTFHPDFPEERIEVVGNPSFDRVRPTDEAARKSIRDGLGIRDGEKLVVYAASSMGQFDLERESVNVLVPWIKKHGYRLAVFFHPNDAKENKVHIQRMQETIRQTLGSLHVSTGSKRASDIAPAADMYVTNYSTEGVRACLRGIPTGFLMGDTAQAYQRSRGGEFPFFPILTTDGLTPALGIFAPNQIEHLRAASDPRYVARMRGALLSRPEFRSFTDGGATDRAVTFFNNVLSKK